ncbi:hypothetical protein B0T26DRAFT_805893 [Lasiosphaeria miniovina]|uniref:Uncharacterized protein n=1 Tax=Lasiosphaeria miniovina TaxID=1954250 RepID=A0AA39ZYJ0_9PEZI|nr:uncharacterized protein B0T26DRAFT_805893 [Lasiosphaeria miniovina]KAK0705987.1 hypothetical protein B0T26DRAFT_805893 [Lasiosphaeria miniovina]
MEVTFKDEPHKPTDGSSRALDISADLNIKLASVIAELRELEGTPQRQGIRDYITRRLHARDSDAHLAKLATILNECRMLNGQLADQLADQLARSTTETSGAQLDKITAKLDDVMQTLRSRESNPTTLQATEDPLHAEEAPGTLKILHWLSVQGLCILADEFNFEELSELVSRLRMWGLGILDGPLSLDHILAPMAPMPDQGNDENADAALRAAGFSLLAASFLRILFSIKYLLVCTGSNANCVVCYLDQLVDALDAACLRNEIGGLDGFAAQLVEPRIGNTENSFKLCSSELWSGVDALYDAVPAIRTMRHVCASTSTTAPAPATTPAKADDSAEKESEGKSLFETNLALARSLIYEMNRGVLMKGFTAHQDRRLVNELEQENKILAGLGAEAKWPPRSTDYMKMVLEERIVMLKSILNYIGIYEKALKVQSEGEDREDLEAMLKMIRYQQGSYQERHFGDIFKSSLFRKAQ